MQLFTQKRWFSRSSTIGIILILALMLGLIFSTQVRSNPNQLVTPESLDTPTPLDEEASYDPAYYGLPDTIGEYRILAVRTAENTRCLKSKIVILQYDQNVNRTTRDELMEVNEVSDFLETDWLISIVGPNTTKEGIISQNEDWNLLIQRTGCLQSGGGGIHLPTETPSPH